MSEMIERVGLAIARHIHKGSDYGLDGDTAFESRRDDFLGVARAAIEAMREPPPLEMAPGVVAYAHVDKSCRPVAFRAGWNAVIDEALSQDPHSLPPHTRADEAV